MVTGTTYQSISVAISSPDFRALDHIDIFPSEVSWKKSSYGFAASVPCVDLRKLSGDDTEGFSVFTGVVVVSFGIRNRYILM